MSVDAAGAQIITLTSDGAELFTTDTAETVELWLDGYVQQTDSVDAGVAVFTVTNMDSDQTGDVKLLSPDGYSNTSSISTIGTIALAPKLISIVPSIGSIGGSILRVTGSGFGISN